VPTEINNVWGSDPDDPNEIVSKYTYAYDNLWRTKWVVRQGDATYGAFANDHHDAFTYSDRNELTQSKRYNNTSPPATTSPGTAYERVFAFDTYGSRDSHTEGSGPALYYCTNALNLCVSVADLNNPDAEFTYDDDDNLTVGRLYEYTYDAENRLIEMEPNKKK
jgi:YD repeat-containing protein